MIFAIGNKTRVTSAFVIVAMLLSFANVSPAKAQVIPTPAPSVGTQATPTLESLPPLPSVLKIRDPYFGAGLKPQPADKRAEDAVRNFERNIIAGLETVTITIVRAGASDFVHDLIAGPEKQPWTLQLSGYVYKETYPYPLKTLKGDLISLRYAVAGLTLDTLRYQATDSRLLQTEFYVEGHPRIEARAMHARGGSAVNIATAIRNDFAVTGPDSTIILNQEAFSSSVIGNALKLVYAATPEQATQWMHGAGISGTDVTIALLAVYASTSTQIATLLQQVYTATPEQATQWMHDAGISGTDVATALIAVS